MSLIGDGAVCIWHDLLPDAVEDFYEWHNREHMPERMGIPGFRRGRRYVALVGRPAYFNLYEVDEVGVLGGADYLERLNAPTPWTRRVVPSFRNVARALCNVAYSAGAGEGGVMLTLRFDIPPADRLRVVEALKRRILPPLAGQTGIAGVHLCLADEVISNVVTVEKQARAGTTQVPPWIALIEGTSQAHVESAGEVLVASIDAEADVAAPAIAAATYDLQHTRSTTA